MTLGLAARGTGQQQVTQQLSQVEGRVSQVGDLRVEQPGPRGGEQHVGGLDVAVDELKRLSREFGGNRVNFNTIKIMFDGSSPWTK